MQITKRTYSEVYAILSLLSFKEFCKIPTDVWNNIDDKREKEIVIVIKDINKYNISIEAKYLLAQIYKKYFATEEEKEIIKLKEKSIYLNREEELRNNYNPDELFKKNERKENKLENKEVTDLVVIKKNIFVRIIEKIKNIFKKKVNL